MGGGNSSEGMHVLSPRARGCTGVPRPSLTTNVQAGHHWMKEAANCGSRNKRVLIHLALVRPRGTMDGRGTARIVGLSMAGIYLLCLVLAAS
jgi:hypothetical protein